MGPVWDPFLVVGVFAMSLSVGFIDSVLSRVEDTLPFPRSYRHFRAGIRGGGFRCNMVKYKVRASCVESDHWGAVEIWVVDGWLCVEFLGVQVPSDSRLQSWRLGDPDCFGELVRATREVWGDCS